MFFATTGLERFRLLEKGVCNGKNEEVQDLQGVHRLSNIEAFVQGIRPSTFISQ